MLALPVAVAAAAPLSWVGWDGGGLSLLPACARAHCCARRALSAPVADWAECETAVVSGVDVRCGPALAVTISMRTRAPWREQRALSSVSSSSFECIWYGGRRDSVSNCYAP